MPFLLSSGPRHRAGVPTTNSSAFSLQLLGMLKSIIRRLTVKCCKPVLPSAAVVKRRKKVYVGDFDSPDATNEFGHQLPQTGRVYKVD